MKRIVCAVLCLMIMLGSLPGYAAISYTLPEKMHKQLEIGSGLKGSITFHGEGNHPFILSMQAFQDVELQFRGIRSNGLSHYYFYQAGEGETQQGLTEFYDRGDQYFLRSDLLPEDVFSIPGLPQLADALSTPAAGNPSAASVLVRLAQLDRETRNRLLEAASEKMSSPLELWVARYGAVSEVRTAENGTSVLDLSYSIPMADLKKEIVTLWTEFIQDTDGQTLIQQLLNEEQKELFANVNLDYYYEAALAALKNDYDVTYTRTVSTLGNQISSTLELPLDEEVMKYQALIIEEKGGLISYTLRGEETIWTLTMGENLDLTQIDAFSIWIMSRPNPSAENVDLDAYHALRVDISHSGSISTDEESRDHERTNWVFSITGDTSRLPEGEDASRYQQETPVDGELKLHYFSKYSQSSPTTLEFDFHLSMDSLNLSAEGQMKTSSPWVFSPFQTEGAIDLSRLSADEATLKLAEYLAAASEAWKQSVPETMPEKQPAAEAAVEDSASFLTEDEEGGKSE